MRIFIAAFVLGLAAVGFATAQELPDLNLDTPNGWSNFFDKIIDFLGKLITPIKEVIKISGNLLIWVLELTIKLIKLGLVYL